MKMEARADTNPKHPSAIDFIVFCADEQYFDLIIEDEQFQKITNNGIILKTENGKIVFIEKNTLGRLISRVATFPAK